MAARGADVCVYVFVCMDVSGIPFAIASTSHRLPTDTGEVSLVSLTSFVLHLCVCDGGRGACNSRCHWDWLRELQFETAGLYLQILGGLLMALVLQLTCL